jgi:hypothetical protein
LRQTDLKSLVAYSSVAHMGIVVGGIMTLSYWGFCGSYDLITCITCASEIKSLNEININQCCLSICILVFQLGTWHEFVYTIILHTYGASKFHCAPITVYDSVLNRADIRNDLHELA